jgi:hypothetical protein
MAAYGGVAAARWRHRAHIIAHRAALARVITRSAARMAHICWRKSITKARRRVRKRESGAGGGKTKTATRSIWRHHACMAAYIKMRVGALRAWNAKDANARHRRNALRAAARKWRGGIHVRLRASRCCAP